MKFELDTDYFNRAGDKVRYVGNNGYFRKSNGDIFCVNEDGVYNRGYDHGLDILGKWEITDDPDRVYVTDYGTKLRNLIPTTKVPKEIIKILIKPEPRIWLPIGGFPYDDIKQIIKEGAGITSKDLTLENHEFKKKCDKIYAEAYERLFKQNKPKKIEYIPGKPFNIEAKKMTGREIYDLIEPLHNKMREIIDAINRMNDAE